MISVFSRVSKFYQLKHCLAGYIKYEKEALVDVGYVRSYYLLDLLAVCYRKRVKILI